MPNFPGIAQIAPRNDAYVYFGKYPKTGNIEVIESANGKRLVQADWFSHDHYRYQWEKKFVPETDTLMDTLTTQFFWEDTKGTMTLSRYLLHDFYHHPIKEKIQIIGTYDRWAYSRDSYSIASEDDSRRESLGLQYVPHSVANEEQYDPEYEYEQICEFYDKNPVVYNYDAYKEYSLYLDSHSSWDWEIYPFNHWVRIQNILDFKKDATIIADPILDIAGGHIEVWNEKNEKIFDSQQSEWNRTYRVQKFPGFPGETLWTWVFPYYVVSAPELQKGTYTVKFFYTHFEPTGMLAPRE